MLKKAKPIKWTRESTEVLFAEPRELALPFTAKKFEVLDRFSCKPFKSQENIDVDTVEELLKGKEADLQKARLKKDIRPHIEPRVKKERPWTRKVSRRDQVNRKRRLVASYLRCNPLSSIAEVCQQTGCDYKTAKKVEFDLKHLGEPAEYEYSHLKKPEEVQQLQDTIDQVEGTYMTITDIKRLHPKFSRKAIRLKLHKAELRYLLMAKNELNPKQPSYTSTQVLRVVNHLSQSVTNNTVTTYYVDEVHFPMVQTSERIWRRLEDVPGQPVFNRRPVCNSKLTTIALCSLEKFVAVQFFKREIVQEDFIYFLQEVLKKLPAGSKVTILADNATWHTAEAVVQSRAGKFLFFNAPTLFMANAIENAFSFVRSGFRKRSIVETVEEEAVVVAKIFFDPANIKRFNGIARNHIRSLLKLLEVNYMQHTTELKYQMDEEKEVGVPEPQVIDPNGGQPGAAKGLSLHGPGC